MSRQTTAERLAVANLSVSQLRLAVARRWIEPLDAAEVLKQYGYSRHGIETCLELTAGERIALVREDYARGRMTFSEFEARLDELLARETRERDALAV
jgi:hypothetical protein